MQVEQRLLFESELLAIGGARVRFGSEAAGELQTAALNVLALPVAGLFVRHEGPRRAALASAQSAVLLPARQSYRLSFPGGVGDDCLTLGLTDAALARLWPAAAGTTARGPARLPAAAPLDAGSMLLRNRLWQALWVAPDGAIRTDGLAAEEACLALWAACLEAARADWGRTAARSLDGPGRSAAAQRRIERVRELIALTPQAPWTLQQLAEAACMSASHLSHCFKAWHGSSLYQYVLRQRLALTLERVLHGSEELSAIAADCGFASHSHLTARFRAFFGITPLALRQTATRALAQQMRRNVTAPRRAVA